MELLQHPRLRSFIRHSGLKQFAYKVYFSVNKPSRYEAKFSDALLSTVRSGDCVWDVGANIGIYTQKLANLVGDSGRVIAFEPFADTFDRLRANTATLPQVQCVKSALGAGEQEIRVVPLAPTATANGVWRVADSDDGEIICIKSGTKLMQEGCPPPTILKIDVEGFEEEVLWGFRECLKGTCCRAIFMEVHFNVLDQRGFLRTASRLVSLLQDVGFKTRWIDRSHLEGKRDLGPELQY